MTARLGKTETLVLRGIALADDVARADYEKAAWGDPTPQHFLIGFQTILSCSRIAAWGRKPSENRIHRALQSLVARGLVERSDVRGMGGGMTLYIRREA